MLDIFICLDICMKTAHYYELVVVAVMTAAVKVLGFLASGVTKGGSPSPQSSRQNISTLSNSTKFANLISLFSEN